MKLVDNHLKRKKRLKKKIRQILHAYEPEKPLDAKDFKFMRDVLTMHPSSDIKIRCGVAVIFVRRNQRFRKNKEFWLRRLDDSETDFSFLECLKPTSPLKKFKIAARATIADDVIAFRQQHLNASSFCPFTGQQLTRENVHVDHAPPETFDKIVNQFIEENTIDICAVELTGEYDGEIGDQFVDFKLKEAFRKYHNERATLRLVSRNANLSHVRTGAQPRHVRPIQGKLF